MQDTVGYLEFIKDGKIDKDFLLQKKNVQWIEKLNILIIFNIFIHASNWSRQTGLSVSDDCILKNATQTETGNAKFSKIEQKPNKKKGGDKGRFESEKLAGKTSSH